jgi:hypothetical protein
MYILYIYILKDSKRDPRLVTNTNKIKKLYL